MARYHFTVHDGDWYNDPEGTELPGDEAARWEATLILRDLKKREKNGRQEWTVEVTEGDRKVCEISSPAEPLSKQTSDRAHG